MEIQKFYEGPKMPEKTEKLDVKIVKDFLENNNINSEDPKIQELIKGVVESSTNTEDSLKTLYAYLSGKSSIEERTIKYSEIQTPKKDENNKTKTLVSEKNHPKKEEKSDVSKNLETKKSTEKISASEKQKEILAYSWKSTDLVEVNGKKYKFEDVKKYLSDGKDGKITDAFYKKLQELKTVTGNGTDKSADSEEKFFIDIIEENRYY